MYVEFNTTLNRVLEWFRQGSLGCSWTFILKTRFVYAIVTGGGIIQTKPLLGLITPRQVIFRTAYPCLEWVWSLVWTYVHAYNKYNTWMWRPLALECTDCCHKIQLQAQKRVYTVHVSICVFHMFTILFNTHIYQYCYICISICIHHFFLIVVPACNLICRVVDVSRGHTVPLKRMLLSTSCSTFG